MKTFSFRLQVKKHEPNNEAFFYGESDANFICTSKSNSTCYPIQRGLSFSLFFSAKVAPSGHFALIVEI